MRRKFLGSLVPFVLSIVLSAFLLAAFHTAPSASAAAAPADGGTDVLNGRLMVITADRLGAPPGTAETILAVMDSDGSMTAVRMEAAAAAGRDWQALDGRQVRLDGGLDEQSGVFVAADMTAVEGQRESATAQVSGAMPVLNILCRFADVQDYPVDRDHVQEMFADSYPGLGHYWRELSYGALSLDPLRTTGWHTLPYSRSHYIEGQRADLAALHNDCAEAAQQEVDPEAFSVVNLFFNDSLGCCAYGGGGTTWIGAVGMDAISIVEHEMGHVFGLPHSGGAEGIYTNNWDIMSRGAPDCKLPSTDFGCLGQHTIAYHKDLLGWLGEDDLLVVPPDGRESLFLKPLGQPGSEKGVLAAKIPLSGSGRYFYTVEYRAPAGYDRALPAAGVIIHEVVEGRRRTYQGVDSALPAVLVETPSGEAVWRTGQTFVDAARGVTIQVGAQSNGAYAVTVSRQEPAPFSCDHSVGLPVSECAALLNLFEASQGPGWQSRSGWGAWEDVCHWQGVTCSGGHVTRLELPGNGLGGQLTARIGDLPYLQVLDLSNNAIGGSIAGEIGRLRDLRYLNLAGTGLSGALPPQLAALQKLDVLYVDGSDLAGPLPLELVSMAQLRTFWFFGTRLCAPADDALLSWLDKPNFASSGLTCHGPLDKRALLPFVLR